MTKIKYKKKCRALFKKAQKIGVELSFSPEDFDCDRLDCLWYGGELATIKVSEKLAVKLLISGDVRAYLKDKEGEIIASVKDRDNYGVFADEMRQYFKKDKQLYTAIDGGKLNLVDTNWVEYDGNISVFDTESENVFIDLGMICDNFLDNNVLFAIEQALDSIEDIKAEIIDIAEVEYGIKVGAA